MGFGKDGKGIIIREDVSITLGALASQSAVKSVGGAALQTTSFRILKTEYFIVMTTSWAAENDQVLLGIANGELSAAEIAACINANGPDDRNDRVKAELASRGVWMFDHLREQPGQTLGVNEIVNDNRKNEFAIRWTFTPTEGWDWFVFNPLDGAITTGPVFRIFAKHYGVWVD